MSKKIRVQPVYIKRDDGTFCTVPAIGAKQPGGGGDGASFDDTEIRNEVSEIKQDLTQLSGRTSTLETALIGVDASITRLEAAI